MSALLAWSQPVGVRSHRVHRRCWGATQPPQEVTIQCPTRESANAQRDEGDQVLQAVKFTDKKVNGLHLDLDEDLQAADCFTEAIRGYQMEVVEPDVMRGLQPAGATRVTLDVIIPSSRGLTPEKWKQTATLCPLDWLSNYSLLRLWHVPKDLHQFVDQLNQQLNHRHMFSRWEINYEKLRVESSSSFRLTTSLKLHCDPSLMASACLLPPAPSFCWALSARLVVLYLGWCLWLLLLCGLGLSSWRGLFLFCWICLVSLCCSSLAGFLFFVFCFWWLLLTPFWSGTLVLFAFTCTTQASIIIGLVCLSADWTGSLVLLTFTGLPCRCFVLLCDYSQSTEVTKDG